MEVMRRERKRARKGREEDGWTDGWPLSMKSRRQRLVASQVRMVTGGWRAERGGDGAKKALMTMK